MSPKPNIPPLPNRRLKEYANGVWDEQYGRFYPYKLFSGVATKTLAAKDAIMFYIKSCAVSAYNSAGNAAGATTPNCTVNRATEYLGRVTVPATVGEGITASAFSTIGVLLDVNTPLQVNISCTGGGFAIVYAEIPADPAGFTEVKHEV